MQMRLYCSRPTIRGPRNLFDRHSFHRAQQEGLALRHGKPLNALRDAFQALAAQQVFLRCRRWIRHLLCRVSFRLGGIETNQPPPHRKTAIAEVVAHEIDRDPRQPGKSLAISAEALLLLKSADETLLREFLRQI